ncbi:hypothetical protein FQA39_LY06358 [Lamprigera yunnana]|nr:hypothetical protein FQA39_LY06358 [Lamprigera yunnana]
MEKEEVENEEGQKRPLSPVLRTRYRNRMYVRNNTSRINLASRFSNENVQKVGSDVEGFQFKTPTPVQSEKRFKADPSGFCTNSDKSANVPVSDSIRKQLKNDETLVNFKEESSNNNCIGIGLNKEIKDELFGDAMENAVLLDKVNELIKEEFSISIDNSKISDAVRNNEKILLIDEFNQMERISAHKENIPWEPNLFENEPTSKYTCTQELPCEILNTDVENPRTGGLKRKLNDTDELVNQDHQSNIRSKKINTSNAATANKQIAMAGFTTGSGKTIAISESGLAKSKQMFSDLSDDNNYVDISIDTKTLMNQSNTGFTTGSGKAIVISESVLAKSKKMFSELNDDNISIDKHSYRNTLGSQQNRSGFTTGSGKAIAISESMLAKSKQMFSELNKDSSCVDKNVHSKKMDNQQGMTGFTTGSGKALAVSQSALSKSKKMFSDFDDNSSVDKNISKKISRIPQSKSDFTTGSGKTIAILESTLARSKQMFSELEEDSSCMDKNSFKKTLGNQQGNIGFVTGTGKAIAISELALAKSKQMLVDLDDDTSWVDKNAYTKANANQQNNSNSTVRNKNAPIVNDQNTSNLGTTENEDPNMLLCSEILNDTETIIFKDEGDVSMDSSKIQNQSLKSVTKKKLGISRCKQIPISNRSIEKAKALFNDLDDNIRSPYKLPSNMNVYSSTPLKDNSNLTKQTNNSTLLSNLNITPVKRPIIEVKCENSPIILHEQTEGDTECWLQNLDKTHKKLVQQIEVLEERKKALKIQKQFLDSQNNTQKRQVLGVLSKEKLSKQRISLKQALSGRKMEDLAQLEQGVGIIPKNAASVHFNCSWNNKCTAVISTKDGAILIPNSQNLIGLSEITAGFKSMPGVDPNLIPSGWIENHYKWIVWKLASYDQFFSGMFTESLSIENIVQQLKYRYDREIDKAERSALRRILENDDVPQKRMVLCVSDIINTNDFVELELTDGWYCVRTVIDDLLKYQIKLSNIVVGTKVIVQCAEILNCNGCYPLEVPDYVRLKINYNCTRRATWDAKLGYQKVVEPFPINLGSIHCEGGNVGCISVYIARVYPLKYMEKMHTGKTVWRNAKAEERRVQEWENKEVTELEMIQQKVQEEYEKELKSNAAIKMDLVDPSQIKSSEVLYRMLETCNDPVTFKENLTSSQLSSVMEYQKVMCVQRNSELLERVSRELKKLKKSKRVVHCVLKLLVVDKLKSCNETVALNIWMPTEEHLQSLKEGFNFFIYNVVAKFNGELASTNKTYFKLQPSKMDVQQFQRSVHLISKLRYTIPNTSIKEFDTIGTVVLIDKSEHNQEVWIADSLGNLLFIKIFDGPNLCCILDNINPGQNVALMNILFCKPKPEFSVGIANQTSVITCFPQQKFLQEALEEYTKNFLPTETFLNNCKEKINVIHAVKGMESSVSMSRISMLMESNDSSAINSDFVNDTMVVTQLTSTDIAMSLIDTDQYL